MRAFAFSARLLVLATVVTLSSTAWAQAPPRSPSDTVREFYKAMRERRIREAFAMSIYKPAIDGLKPQEFDGLRPDFEKMAAVVPETIEINGEQISGDEATVFVKVPDPEKGPQPEPVALMLVKGAWIIGDKASQEVVKKSCKAQFLAVRIEINKSEGQGPL